MDTTLKQLQEYMIKYTETIGSVLNIDIEIVDEKLIRVSGTGVYKNAINESVISESSIYNTVLSSQKEVILVDHCTNDICNHCTNYIKCLNKFVIAVPIMYKYKVIGVIGAVSLDESKKKYMKEKVDVYLEFMKHISDLITIKIDEYQQQKYIDKKFNMLTDIIENVEKGVIILDSQKCISYINNMTLKKLNLSSNPLGSKIEILSIASGHHGKDKVTVKIEDYKFDINAKIIPVYPYIHQYDKIIIFDEVYDYRTNKNKFDTGWGDTNISSIIGDSNVMKQVRYKTQKFANSTSTVLITGDSGTGKELIARAIHSEGNRWNKPFIAINCAAIPESLLESELFGYVKGAFSGASSSGRLGKFELANEGVIFLDEIGDMSLHLQAKLLRVLQERKFARIGSNKLLDLDIRVIAATNKNLLSLVKEGKFRDDLYYRLNVIPINLPSLREREGDIKDIMMKFIEKYSVEFNTKLYNMEDNVMNMLLNYNWPGNIRELENVVEYMMNLVGEEGIINESMVPLDVINYYDEKNNEETEVNCRNTINNKDEVNVTIDNNIDMVIDIRDDKVLSIEEIIPLKDVEMEYINKLLDRYGRDTKSKKIIAKKLGIGLSTLYRKLEEN